jgi:HKD family nuclease
MSKITFLRPIDQPIGNKRLLQEIKDCLQSTQFSHFKLAVGFAKVGPLARLSVPLQNWREAGKSIEGIFGIDQLGTSQQALKFALERFNRIYVTRAVTSRQSTFHPKLYIFSGEKIAVCFYGSHNLTVGGTETNFEGGVRIDFNREEQSDESSFQEALGCWTSLLPENCAATELLNISIYDEYLRDGLLLDESRASYKPTVHPSQTLSRISRTATNNFRVKPPSSLPKEILPKPPSTTKEAKVPKGAVGFPTSAAPAIPSKALVIQIVPHHNGEIFLSKIAINQNPTFFDFPFSGETVPKKSSNKSYPQRIPDPVVNITVFNEDGNLAASLTRSLYPLNMVFYETKAEIRITVNPEMAREIPTHSVLVMSKPDEPESYDYNMEIYFPGSEQFNNYLNVCNQTLPSGGAEQPRRMGWL